MIDVTKLKAVLAGVHPVTAAPYSADNEEATSQGNFPNCEENVRSVSGQDIFEASTADDRAALSADERTLFYAIVGMGTILVNGVNTKAALLGMFGAETTTRANFAKLQKRTVSHFQKEGLGRVRVGDVARVRRV